MYYKDTGFRALYKNFVAFSLNDKLKPCIENYPAADKANCILTYGYIDRQAGLTMEILAAGFENGGKFSFADTTTEKRAFIRVGAVMEDEFFVFTDEDGGLSRRYAEKLDVLKHYAVSEKIEETRKMAFLDVSRDKCYPDDVLVFLTRQGLKPEGCWVRITGLGNGFFLGTLLNEPDQDFGYHSGERIAFYVGRQKDKSFILYTDMTPSRKLTAKDLEDGTLLKEAVSIFNQERTEEYFLDILKLLRDSYVWIPCNAVLGDADAAELDEAIKEAGDDLSSMVGKVFSNKEDIRMIPDILQSGDQFFFPVFSSAAEMGEYGEHFSKVQKHMLEVIPLARNNEKKVAGIVLNAFTDPFVLDAEIFDIVETMKSRLNERSTTQR